MVEKTGFSETLVQHNNPSLQGLKKLVSKLDNLSPANKLLFFKKIKKLDLKFLIEIFYNFIRGNIIVNQRSYKNLKKHKRFLYKFISKGTSVTSKKKILNTLKGLNIICILVPLVKKTFNL